MATKIENVSGALGVPRGMKFQLQQARGDA